MSLNRKQNKSYIQDAPKKYFGARGLQGWLYTTSFWRGNGKTKEGVRNFYLRKNVLCEECLEKGITRVAEEVDHIKAVKHKATMVEFKAASVLTNLKALCKGHHAQKTAKDINAINKVSD